MIQLVRVNVFLVLSSLWTVNAQDQAKVITQHASYFIGRLDGELWSYAVDICTQTSVQGTDSSKFVCADANTLYHYTYDDDNCDESTLSDTVTYTTDGSIETGDEFDFECEGDATVYASLNMVEQGQDCDTVAVTIQTALGICLNSMVATTDRKMYCEDGLFEIQYFTATTRNKCQASGFQGVDDDENGVCNELFTTEDISGGSLIIDGYMTECMGGATTTTPPLVTASDNSLSNFTDDNSTDIDDIYAEICEGCSEDADCIGDSTCEEGFCYIDECNNDNNCGDGEICVLDGCCDAIEDGFEWSSDRISAYCTPDLTCDGVVVTDDVDPDDDDDESDLSFSATAASFTDHVCGLDGITYGNEDYAMCYGTCVAADGECDEHDDFFDQILYGLPVWAWFAIGLMVLLVFICCCCWCVTGHRNKNKNQYYSSSVHLAAV